MLGLLLGHVLKYIAIMGSNSQAMPLSAKKAKPHAPCIGLLRGLHSESLEVEAIQVHHLVPGRHEVLDELLPRVHRGIDLGQGAQLGV